jgi:hypothetical protein
VVAGDAGTQQRAVEHPRREWVPGRSGDSARSSRDQGGSIRRFTGFPRSVKHPAASTQTSFMANVPNVSGPNAGGIDVFCFRGSVANNLAV